MMGVRTEADARAFVEEQAEPDGKLKEKGKLLKRLLDARGQRVPLPEILALRISQYGRCVKQLRGTGFRIENGGEWVNGKRHTWFQLLFVPRSVETDTANNSPVSSTPTVAAPEADSLFANDLAWRQQEKIRRELAGLEGGR
jgi:hypothetical protein